VLAGVDPADDRIDDARSTVDDVQRRVEALLVRLFRRQLCQIFIDYPIRAAVKRAASFRSLLGVRYLMDTATLPLAGNHSAAALVVEREIGKRMLGNGRLHREIEEGFSKLAHVSTTMQSPGSSPWNATSNPTGIRTQGNNT
jgi:hypothetical protein